MKKIKIAHIITRMILGGAQENTLLSVENLQKMSNYEVDLITGPALGPEGSLLERARLNNVNVILIPELRRNLNIYYDCIAFIKLLKILRKKKYDIVHTHSSKAGILARLAAKLAKTKVIIHTIHGLPYHQYEIPLLNAVYVNLERWVAHYSDKIVTVCPEMSRKALAAHVGRPEQYVSIYSGIETKIFLDTVTADDDNLRQKLGIPHNAFVVGKIARLFHLKGHMYLLPAAKKVIERVPNTYFMLVGDGILKDELATMAKKLEIEKNIIFVGLIPPEAVPSYLQCMDVVVHLSLREGLPRVVPQAFLCKRPVIVYDIDGARDIVDNGKNGYLIAPGEINELSDKIIDLLQDNELRKSMGLHGYRKAMDLFPYDRMVKQLDSLYNGLYEYKSN